MTDVYSNEQIASTYRVVLACFRRPCDHKGMAAYTERSLYTFHRELEKRGLPRAPDDNTNPDRFAGYSTIDVLGKPLQDILPPEGIQAILDFAYKVRVGEADLNEVGAVLRPFFPEGEVTTIGRTIVEGIENFHNQSPPPPPLQHHE